MKRREERGGRVWKERGEKGGVLGSGKETSEF